MNKKLKAKIIEQFGTQADFAQVVNADESLVSRVVRGRRTLDATTQATWAKILKTEAGEVFS